MARDEAAYLSEPLIRVILLITLILFGTRFWGLRGLKGIFLP